MQCWLASSMRRTARRRSVQQLRAVMRLMIGASRESIGNDVGLALDVLDVEVEVRR